MVVGEDQSTAAWPDGGEDAARRHPARRVRRAVARLGHGLLIVLRRMMPSHRPRQRKAAALPYLPADRDLRDLGLTRDVLQRLRRQDALPRRVWPPP